MYNRTHLTDDHSEQADLSDEGFRLFDDEAALTDDSIHTSAEPESSAKSCHSSSSGPKGR